MEGVKLIRLTGARLLLGYRKRRFARDEWFDLVTPAGRKLGEAPRSVCHRGPGLLHSVVHLHVTDSEGRLYLQKRSLNKKIQPGKWDTSVGGHVDSGEAVTDALVRETREELGMEGFSPRELITYVWESEQESELVHSYTTRWDGPVKPDPEEIEEGRFWSRSEIEEGLGKGVFTPNFEQEYVRIRASL
ncbi:MAG: NUDIX domain-containing protein [Spirochaetales bacterium]|nr:NUDIX domain-containing protein [Spirochaetales bacterium]